MRPLQVGSSEYHLLAGLKMGLTSYEDLYEYMLGIEYGFHEYQNAHVRYNIVKLRARGYKIVTMRGHGYRYEKAPMPQV